MSLLLNLVINIWVAKRDIKTDFPKFGQIYDLVNKVFTVCSYKLCKVHTYMQGWWGVSNIDTTSEVLQAAYT